MGHWVASPGLSFSICNMGIFLLSQALCLVRKTPLSTGSSTQLTCLPWTCHSERAAQSLHCLHTSSSSSLLALALHPLCECFLLKNPTRSPQDLGSSQCSPTLRLRAEGSLESPMEMNGVAGQGRAVGWSPWGQAVGAYTCTRSPPWCRGGVGGSGKERKAFGNQVVNR